MLNLFNKGQGQEAVLQYLDGDIRVIKPGDYVICAVSGARIPVDDLKYWSVERQEAYRDATAVHLRWGSKAGQQG